MTFCRDICWAPKACKGLISCVNEPYRCPIRGAVSQSVSQSVTTVSTRASARADVGRSPASRSIRVSSLIYRSFNSSFHHDSSPPVTHVAREVHTHPDRPCFCGVRVSPSCSLSGLAVRNCTRRSFQHSRTRGASTQPDEHTQRCALNC